MRFCIMTRLTLKQWYDVLIYLRLIYPDWEQYDERTRKRLANKHGYPYHTAENSPRGIFTKTFDGSAAFIDARNLQWQNEMLRQYRTFRVVGTTCNSYFKGFDLLYQLTVTYRL